MAFPSIATNLISGAIGEISHDAPTTALVAVAAANITIGTACTWTDKAAETVSPGGTGTFAGIAINPKAFASATLATATADIVPANHPVELLREGEVYVQLSTNSVIGDPVFSVDATGALGAGAPAAGQTAIAGATVYRHNVSPETPRLAVIRIKN